MAGWLGRRRNQHAISKMADPVTGTLQVTAVSGPPSLGNVTFSNYHLIGVITAPDLPPTAVEQNGIARVAQWPMLGHDLPVTVDRANPTAFRISWDAIPAGAQQALAQARTIALQEQTNLNFGVLQQAQDRANPTSAGGTPADDPTVTLPVAQSGPPTQSPSAPVRPSDTPPPHSAATPILTGTVTAVATVPTPLSLAPAGGLWDLTVDTSQGPKLVRVSCHTAAERDTTAIVGAQLPVRPLATNPDIAELVAEPSPWTGRKP